MMKNKKEINYLYFLLTLIYVSLLSLSHILPLQSEYLPHKIFFSIYSILQAILEVSLFILIGFVFKKISSTAYKLYISFLFLFLLAQFADYILIKLMDTTIIKTFKIFFSSGIDHFIAAILALNLNWTMGLIIIACIISIPIIGIFFYLFTHKITRLKPVTISVTQITVTILVLSSSLFCLELFSRPYLTAELHAKYQKILPLKGTFLSPCTEKIMLKKPLTCPSFKSSSPLTVCKEKPNIFLFIIETLRGDFISEVISPNIQFLKQYGTSAKVNFSNANASPQSWFSIFHSRFPYHWHSFKERKQGSLPLTLLKNAGYKIHVYTSADLRYFNMNEMIFGDHLALADTFHDYTTMRHSPPERDQMAIQALIRDIPTLGQGNLFIIFLDSTHSEYSWAKSFTPKFLPITKEIDYLTVSQSRKGIEKIKNRYRNAISFVDGLIGKVMNELTQKNMFETSCFILTGDHGEEFFEQGALFHGTHLNFPQTNIPIIYKFPNNPKSSLALSSHVDIFPTLFHILTDSNSWDTLFDGKSIFNQIKNPFVLTVQQNGGEIPQEFCLQDKDHKMILRFGNTSELYNNRELEVISLKTHEDLNVPMEEQSAIQKKLEKGLNLLLN